MHSICIWHKRSNKNDNKKNQSSELLYLSALKFFLLEDNKINILKGFCTKYLISLHRTKNYTDNVSLTSKPNQLSGSYSLSFIQQLIV